MRHLAATLALALLAAPAPVAAQEPDEGLSLMEEGMQLFFRGLMSEVDPALEELEGMAEEMLPLLQELRGEMGPAFRQLLAEVEDWSVYHAPEMLPNGDIILRRKTETEPEAEPGPGEPAPDSEAETGKGTIDL